MYTWVYVCASTYTPPVPVFVCLYPCGTHEGSQHPSPDTTSLPPKSGIRAVSDVRSSWSPRDEPLPHGPGVRVPAIQDRPHLQGGDAPGQEQGGLQRTVHGLLPGARQTKGNPRPMHRPRTPAQTHTHMLVHTCAPQTPDTPSPIRNSPPGHCSVLQEAGA